jgi:hypothetical protein
MRRLGWDVRLTEYGDGHWRARRYVTGMAHSIVGGVEAGAMAGGAGGGVGGVEQRGVRDRPSSIHF